METDKEDIITYEAIFELLRKERLSDALQRLEQGFYSNTVGYIKEKSGSNDKELVSNAKKMVKEIYERRERKIVGLAIDRVKLGIDGLNTSNLLKEEREIFERLVEDLLSGRKMIIERVLCGEEPLLGHNMPLNEVKASNDIQSNTSLVRFLHAVPKFVGKELEEYGPFEAEEIANLPVEIANLLIAKSRAEEIKDK